MSHPLDCKQPLPQNTGSEQTGNSRDCAGIDTSLSRETDQKVVCRSCMCVTTDAHNLMDCKRTYESTDVNLDDTRKYIFSNGDTRKCMISKPENVITDECISSQPSVICQGKGSIQEPYHNDPLAKPPIDCENVNNLYHTPDDTNTQIQISLKAREDSRVHTHSRLTGNKQCSSENNTKDILCDSVIFSSSAKSGNVKQNVMSSNVPNDSGINIPRPFIPLSDDQHIIASNNDRSTNSRDISSNSRDRSFNSRDSGSIRLVGQLNESYNNFAIYETDIESDKTNCQSQRENGHKECNFPICSSNASDITKSNESKDVTLNCDVTKLSPIQSPVAGKNTNAQVQPVDFAKTREEYTREKCK